MNPVKKTHKIQSRKTPIKAQFKTMFQLSVQPNWIVAVFTCSSKKFFWCGLGLGLGIKSICLCAPDVYCSQKKSNNTPQFVCHSTMPENCRGSITKKIFDWLHCQKLFLGFQNWRHPLMADPRHFLDLAINILVSWCLWAAIQGLLWFWNANQNL